MGRSVREAIEIVTADGWRLARMRGSHRVFVHPVKPGNVVIAGHPRKDLPVGTWLQIMKKAGTQR